MHHLFRPRTQAIQLSSDDEDEFSGSSGGCMPCLPRFLSTHMGPIQLSGEDATFDDYLDPNTTTTIEPLLNEFNAGNRQTNDAFGGAVLHERSLTRNPFASAPTFGNTSSTRDLAAAPQMDFFIETDTDAEDAEFLSDHRISAVIGDTSKLSRQFELFQVTQQEGDSTIVKGEPEGDGDHVEPYEFGNDDWSKKLDMTNEEEDNLLDTADGLCNFGNIMDVELDSNLPDITSETMDLNTSTDNCELGEGSSIITKGQNINDVVSINIGVDNDTLSDGYSNENCFEKATIVESGYSSNSDDHHSKEGATKESTTEISADPVPTNLVPTNSVPTLFAPSSPPSPTPTVPTNQFHPSTDQTTPVEVLPLPLPLPLPAVSIAPSFPPTELPDQVSSFETSMSPPSSINDSQPYQQPLTSNTKYNSINETPLFPTASTNKTSHPSIETTMGTENDINGKHKSSVTSVAHSFLGDKLDDFTEKLAFIRKNIIMSLDDSNDDDDQEENMLNIRQQQQIRRSRSGSLQDWRQQSFDPFVSRFSGKSRQQRQSLSNDHDVQHRRSNSMMDGATSSFFKRAQQTSDKSQRRPAENNSDSPQTRSYSSPTLPPRSSVPHQQQPVISRSTGVLGPRQNNTGPLQGVYEDEEEEDLFDFSKVIAMGKNVRNISEDLMGNGIRLFNDFSTRMKNNTNHRPPNQQSSTDHEYFINDPAI